MEQEVLDLRKIPNEFIIAAYNMATKYPIEADAFTLSADEYPRKMASFISSINSSPHQKELEFFTTIHPKCSDITNQMEMAELKNFQDTFVALGKNTKKTDILSTSFESKVLATKDYTRNTLLHIKNIKNTSERFCNLLKMLYSTYNGNFNEYDPVDLSHPQLERFTITLYPNYVVGFDTKHGIKYDLYTKNLESLINQLKTQLYIEHDFLSETETPAENE